MTDHAPLRIGTRGSALALVQANIALSLLKESFPKDPAAQNASLVIITTTGDRIKDRPLTELGGKGLFSKELEFALESREIDFAVHSLKDMETFLSPKMILASYLRREDPRDVLITPKASTFDSLPTGSVVGTCAPRRVAQILHHRPDLICVPLRGNVDTRIRKLQEGKMDAIVLALAGLLRLGRQGEGTYIFPESDFLPAVGQGVIALECRKGDTHTQSYLSALNHAPTEQCVLAERAFLSGLEGSCQTPIGGHATIQDDGRILLDALISNTSGTILHRTQQLGDDPIELGLSTAKILNERAGPDFWNLPCTS